ncbi:ATP-binding protein [Alistipes sp. ZOR0009]|uniref:ATP-binding protein n=1 Tax=Alistipes sp. ZOR0009 TaxID=1339253 RepID=UPI00068EBBDF|nr:ATP-binding protein [Alistipes sp. ZOR0009]
MFKSLRPLLSFDLITVQPEVEITLANDDQPKESLDEIFEYLKKHDDQFIVAIDEFQQILVYPEQNVEALFRSYSQQLSNVHFIFSGSQRHVMEGMFRSPARPFYRSTELMFLDKIPVEEYVKFAIEKFTLAEKKISEELIVQLYKKVLVHTWYVLYMLNRLYSLPVSYYSTKELDEVVKQVLMENEPFYKGYTKLVTSRQ